MRDAVIEYIEGHRFCLVSDPVVRGEVHKHRIVLHDTTSEKKRIKDAARKSNTSTARFVREIVRGKCLWVLGVEQYNAALLHQFFPDAARNMPNEYGAWIVWNEQTGNSRYQPLEALSSGKGHLSIERPALKEGEHLLVDMHSHGELPAFFSSTDDKDDSGEVKLSYVLGSLGDDNQTSKIRLCLNGLFIGAEVLLESSNFAFS